MPVIPEGASSSVIIAILLAWVVVTWLNGRSTRKVREHQKQQSATLSEVREQVANSHASNLRDDLDDIHKDIRGLRKDVGGIRGENREFREEVREVRDELREVREDVRDNQTHLETFEHNMRAVMRRTHPEEDL